MASLSLADISFGGRNRGKEMAGKRRVRTERKGIYRELEKKQERFVRCCSH